MVTGRGQTVTERVTYGNREGVTHGNREGVTHGNGERGYEVTASGYTW